MDIEDLFKGRHDRKQNHHHSDYRYDDHDQKHKDHHYGGYGHGNYKMQAALSILRSLPHKKALLAGAVILAVLVLVIGIALLWAVVPLIANLGGYVEANGIQGLLDFLLSFVQRLWTGNG